MLQLQETLKQMTAMWWWSCSAASSGLASGVGFAEAHTCEGKQGYGARKVTVIIVVVDELIWMNLEVEVTGTRAKYNFTACVTAMACRAEGSQCKVGKHGKVLLLRTLVTSFEGHCGCTIRKLVLAF